ncbi:SIS domain-containing protein [Prosthecomicrobium pneumaticum]|uniref:Glutamine--fructose-6-phosphate aminotransferase [isomerizing] n=1 Tax=Prosthecomicrobium pneumaticum TaxID=81895 RepID=A0A7W9L1Z3_9HYPH|nr:SIS domain-containing protein [Prosthecomicrobium pneumaticum]MBB5753068.1 glucosamine--fructose-6-phosphate aminotransferase (isomerizing) [Prosthecomicrobium pneumaticum]
MSLADHATPLLAPDSPLDARSRDIVRALFEKEAARIKALPNDDPLNPIRRRRVEITRTEIEGQPERLRTTLETQRDAVAAIAASLARRPPKRIYLTGCGDSYAVMVAARVLLEEGFGVACEPMQALDLAYYFHAPIDADTLVVTLSSTGTTTRTVEAMLRARALGARTLALSNTPGSTLMVESDEALLIHAERKGWPTQASTAAFGLLAALAIAVLAARGGDPARVDALTRALDAVPDQIAAVIARHEAEIATIAAREAERSIYLFCGGGPSFASAFFGAAKIKECTPDHALAIPLEEYHHYQSQKRGDPLWLIAPAGLSVPRARDTAEEGRRAGGTIYTVATEGDPTFDALSDAVLFLPPMLERLAPLVYTVPVQLFAYHVAMTKFARADEAAG